MSRSDPLFSIDIQDRNRGRKRKLTELSKEKRKQISKSFRNNLNLTESRDLEAFPSHILSLALLGQDPQENVQQEEYNDYVKRRRTGKGFYLPLDKKETMRTGKSVNLMLPLTDFFDPSGFTEGY